MRKSTRYRQRLHCCEDLFFCLISATSSLVANSDTAQRLYSDGILTIDGIRSIVACQFQPNQLSSDMKTASVSFVICVRLLQKLRPECRLTRLDSALAKSTPGREVEQIKLQTHQMIYILLQWECIPTIRQSIVCMDSPRCLVISMLSCHPVGGGRTVALPIYLPLIRIRTDAELKMSFYDECEAYSETLEAETSRRI